MMNRTVTTQVTFHHPFRIDGIAEAQQAGTYIVETEEEQLAGVSFTAWRRLETVIRLPRLPGGPMVDQVVTVDPLALEAALALDVRDGSRR
jgi:hypothetical protein